MKAMTEWEYKESTVFKISDDEYKRLYPSKREPLWKRFYKLLASWRLTNKETP